MARSKRYIKKDFFTNTDLPECNPLARLLFIGLWVIVDRDGRVEDNPKRIKAQILPYDDCDVDNLLEQLVPGKQIVRYQVGDQKILQVVNFCKHQTIHRDEASSILPSYPNPDQDLTKSFTITTTLTNTTTESPDGDPGIGDGNLKNKEQADHSQPKSEAKEWSKTAFKVWNEACGINSGLEARKKLRDQDVDLLWTHFQSSPTYREDSQVALGYVATATWPDGNFTPSFLEFWKPESIKRYKALGDKKLKALSQIQNAPAENPFLSTKAEIERLASQKGA